MWSLSALRHALPPIRSITTKCHAIHRPLSTLLSEVVRLNNLADNEGSHKRSKRVGRGIGSGKGKTCGRGHKGQKARAGGKAGRGPGFEGGQTPIYQRVPKRGFNNRFATPMTVINLDKLQLFIDMGRIDANHKITLKELVDCGMVTCCKVKFGIKLLGKGAEHLTTPVEIEVTQASTCAIKAVEAVGGSITAVYYNRLGLRALLKPHKFDVLPRFARPNPKKMRYYTNYEKRGYLSPEMQAKKLLSVSE